MGNQRAFITSIGIISAAGNGWRETVENLKSGQICLTPIDIFQTSFDSPPLVGQAPILSCRDEFPEDLPACHQLAWQAVNQTGVDKAAPPDAIVVGGTIGGILNTEQLLKKGIKDPFAYRFHGPHTITTLLARELLCPGPAITVSTACSSGAAVLKVGLELIRSGQAKIVLCVGVDSLCRLTLYGFSLLQLIDPAGTRPLDRDRAGLSLGEGAAAILLEAGESASERALAELRGGGLTCDAYHAVAPSPDGKGALAAMEKAIYDAGVNAADIEYINIHGTGTPDNDAAEAAAVRSLFGDKIPPLSSIKGVLGHTLGAAGAIEAAVGVMGLSDGFMPPNVGLSIADPQLGLRPITKLTEKEFKFLLTNSFGFGGNNASLVLGQPDLDIGPINSRSIHTLSVIGATCLTGSGNTNASFEAFSQGLPLSGLCPAEEIGKGLPSRTLRRLKRLSQMTLTLTQAALDSAEKPVSPHAIFFGTGYGSQSETYDFIRALFDSNEKFASPIDFISSVHNAPAGQASLYTNAVGPNLTCSGGNYSFEQSVFLTGLLSEDEDKPSLIIAADEYHSVLTPLLSPDTNAADGGGGLIVSPAQHDEGIRIRTVFQGCETETNSVVKRCVEALQKVNKAGLNFNAIFAGIPSDRRDKARLQLDEFISLTGFNGPIIDYRRLLGDFPSVTAVAVVLAVKTLQQSTLSAALAGGNKNVPVDDILVLSLGDIVTTMEVFS